MLLPRLLRPVPVDLPLGGHPPIPREPIVVASAGGRPFVGDFFARLLHESGELDRCAWLRDPPTTRTHFTRAVHDSLLLRARDDGRRTGSVPGRPDVRGGVPGGLVRGQLLVVEATGRTLAAIRRILDDVAEMVAATDGCVLLAPTDRAPRALREPTLPVHPLNVSELVDAGAIAAGLDGSDIAHVRSMVRASDVVLADLAAAAPRRSVDAVSSAVRAGGWRRSWLRRLTRSLLFELDDDERDALTVAVRTGYWHPQLCGGSVATEALRPWMAPLEHDWGVVRPIWREGLERELARLRSRAVEWPSPAGAGVVTPMWRPVLDVRMLGSFEVRLDGRLIGDLGGQLPSSLLRYLLTRPDRAAHRDELIEVFWPEADPKAARNRLQVAVSSLRRAVRDAADVDIVEFDGGRYHVSRALEVTTDYDDFEQSATEVKAAVAFGDDVAAAGAAGTALRLYRGPLCPDVPYDEWTIYPRERMRMLYGDVLEILMRVQWAAGDHDGCLVTAARILDDDPCREDAHRLLMRSYLALGRPHQALRQYEACRRILQASLDVAPSAETVAAYGAARDAVTAGLGS